MNIRPQAPTSTVHTSASVPESVGRPLRPWVKITSNTVNGLRYSSLIDFSVTVHLHEYNLTALCCLLPSIVCVILKYWRQNISKPTVAHMVVPAEGLLDCCDSVKQDAQLSQRDRAAGCVIVFAKSRTLELGENDLRTL